MYKGGERDAAILFTSNKGGFAEPGGYIYGAVKGYREAMFTAAVQSLDGADLIVTAKLTRLD